MEIKSIIIYYTCTFRNTLILKNDLLSTMLLVIVNNLRGLIISSINMINKQIKYSA